MTGAPATAARPTGQTGEAQQVLAGRRTPEQVRAFLAEDVPALLAVALGRLLPDAVGPVRARVTRAKLKPGRKLTVSVDVSGDGVGSRPATVTWAPSSAPPSVPEELLARVTAVQRAPFSALVLPPDDSGMGVLLAPVDPAFPRLVDVYDPERLAGVLAGAGAGELDGPLTVTPLRYRPGQRHVVLVHSAHRRGHRLFAKCYRDDTGRRAVAASGVVAEALSSGGAAASVAVAAGYSASHKLALWTGHDGTPMSEVVAGTRADVPAVLARAGAALRAIHEAVPTDPGGGGPRSDPVAEAAATRRAVEHVTPLARGAGARVAALLEATVVDLLELPPESGHLLHGDFKCDNLLVEEGGLRLLDLDRVTVGDPALDLGKLTADLRWWDRGASTGASDLVAAFLDGYGPCPPGRLARAHRYDVLFQLRAAGRRVPLHEPGWADAVDACLETAECTRRSGA